MASILIIDDEEGIRFSLRGILEDEGYDVFEAASGEDGLSVLSTENIDMVFLDIWLPGMDGLTVLDTMRAEDFPQPVIMISGHGNIETAVNAIKKGAHDFIEKPLSLEKVLISAAKTLEYCSLQRENMALRSRIEDSSQQNITGNSPAICAIREQMMRVAPTDAWVLITGENGTGKEIAARLLYAHSQRNKKPFVAMNCAAIPEELIESELFGHEKGAFTGAERTKMGKFEMAHQGTLFLDEIGDMSLKTQAKILRILQEQSFERVGGHKSIRVDVRVIAATNKNLEEEIAAGRFRQDLYFRLRVIPLELPPLRERGDDIFLLIEDFTRHFIALHGFKPVQFTEEALAVLRRYPWYGNVRELKNFIERMLIMHAGQKISAAMLPPEYHSTSPERATASVAEYSVVNGQESACADAEDATAGTGLLSDVPLEALQDFKEARNLFEAKFLEAKLQEYSGNVSRLAEAIGLERSYLHRKLKSYNIQTGE